MLDPGLDPAASATAAAAASHDKGPEAEEGVELQEGECLRGQPRPGRAGGARRSPDRAPTLLGPRRGRPRSGGADSGGHHQRPAGGVRRPQHPVPVPHRDKWRTGDIPRSPGD
ncbi:USF2 isoform 7 [Pongo abelii]|uniref:USF2 isoform 7 n=1 Tax=Pongo abelii TaxID=9601 RepID=A0A2J8RRC7_PONAB|nr:USF2 isoform 7 [Pongo abelii]